MTDPATPVRHDDLPLSDDQLSQIAGGGPRRGGDKGDGGGTMFALIWCETCQTNVTDLSTHQATVHSG